jgi:hypothetical protein
MVISAMNNRAAIIAATHADSAARPNATGSVNSPGAYERVSVGRR